MKLAQLIIWITLVVISIIVTLWMLTLIPTWSESTQFSGEIVVELLPCPTEDSVNCYWDASEQGNGQGNDLVNP